MEARTYYQILGVSQTCTQGEIKRAYHRNALRLHPDKNGGSARSKRKFQQMKDAYDTLSDPVARSEYDDTIPRPHYEPQDDSDGETSDELPDIKRPNKTCLWQRPDPTPDYPEREPFSPQTHDLQDAQNAIFDASEILEEWWELRSSFPSKLQTRAYGRQQKSAISKCERTLGRLRAEIEARDSFADGWGLAQLSVVRSWNELGHWEGRMKKAMEQMKIMLEKYRVNQA